MTQENQTAPDGSQRAAVQNETRAHLRGPWVYAPASEEGSAVVSPPLDAEDSIDPWWTAIIDCADDDVANDIARLMGAAPETAAERDRLKAINAELLAALQCFLSDERFDVAVGGNPIAVNRMLANARAAINRATGDAR